MNNTAEDIDVIKQLNEIRELGTSFWKDGSSSGDTVPTVGFNHNNVLTCSDGFSVSVTAGWGVKSIPNPGWAGFPKHYSGPYDNFEVGRPSELPEPWGLWRLFCSNEEEPTEAKYYYVPYVMVEQLLLDHEGCSPTGFPLTESNPNPTPLYRGDLVQSPNIQNSAVALAEPEPVLTGGKALRGTFAHNYGQNGVHFDDE